MSSNITMGYYDIQTNHILIVKEWSLPLEIEELCMVIDLAASLGFKEAGTVCHNEWAKQ